MNIKSAPLPRLPLVPSFKVHYPRYFISSTLRHILYSLILYFIPFTRFYYSLRVSTTYTKPPPHISLIYQHFNPPWLAGLSSLPKDNPP